MKTSEKMVDLFTHKPLSLQPFLFVKSLDERHKTLLVFDHLVIYILLVVFRRYAPGLYVLFLYKFIIYVIIVLVNRICLKYENKNILKENNTFSIDLC